MQYESEQAAADTVACLSSVSVSFLWVGEGCVSEGRHCTVQITVYRRNSR
jgi:hypothetical protein